MVWGTNMGGMLLKPKNEAEGGGRGAEEKEKEEEGFPAPFGRGRKEE